MSSLYVGITDNDWFKFLKELNKKKGSLEEVNFWIPSGRNFVALKPGELFLFKLHSPIHKIAGGGFFVRFLRLPLSYAWYSFGEMNGVPNLLLFRKRISGYRNNPVGDKDPIIGCVILHSPFFLNESDYIDVPEDWKRGIQQGKKYSIEKGYGKELLEAVMKVFRASQFTSMNQSQQTLVKEIEANYGTPQLIFPRLGQSAFRALVADEYEQTCAITGEKLLPALEAAHIKPFSLGGPHKISNGILIRRDLHALFDRGYLAIVLEKNHSNYKVLISSKVSVESDYKKLNNSKLIIVPDNYVNKPNPEFLTWHYENIFMK